MKKLLTVVFVTLFAASTGALATGHTKGEKDAKLDKSAKAEATKTAAKKAVAKKTEAKKADAKGEGK
jgi:hypothetical protein